MIPTNQEKKLWWEKKYIENVNIRITQIQDNTNIIDNLDYFKNKAQYIHDISFNLWTKDIYFDSIILFFNFIFDGITIGNKKYGGVKKILFCEIISAYNEIVLKIFNENNFKTDANNYIFVSKNNNTSNSNVNSLLFGYILYKQCAKLNIKIPEIVESIKDLKSKIAKDKCDKLYNLYIVDDISFSGNQLLNKIQKIDFQKLKGNIYFVFSYVLTDTIYSIYKYQESKQIPKNINFVFHSCIFNYPIYFINKFKNTNSRFFCLGDYYVSVFYYYTPNSAKFNNILSFDKSCLNTRYIWYLYCEKCSYFMDLLNYNFQKKIFAKYGAKDNCLFPFEQKDKYCIQFNMNFCEYKINNSAISVNNYLLFNLNDSNTFEEEKDFEIIDK